MIFSIGLNSTGGRNNFGVKTRNAGGKAFHKRKYRFIDFKRLLKNQSGVIKRLEKDPFRSAFIGLVLYNNGVISYIITTQNMNIGSIIFNYDLSFVPKHHELLNGNSFCINSLPTGSLINNIELIPGLGSVFVRAAGTTSKIVKKFSNQYVQIKLKSKEQRLINSFCFVVLGVVSNSNNHLVSLRKAGQSRWLGVHPHVRGRAKNPVDHPHGGRTNGGISPRTPNGAFTKGSPTRKNKRTDSFIILDKRKKFK